MNDDIFRSVQGTVNSEGEDTIDRMLLESSALMVRRLGEQTFN